MASSTSFSQNIAKFIEKTKTKADEVIRGVALELLGGVIDRSPVDTGFFRSNWRVAIGEPDLSVNSQGVVEPVQRHFKEGSKVNLKPRGAAAAEAVDFKPAAKRKHENRIRKLVGSAAATLAVGASAALSAKFGDTIHITNNTEYGEALENGHLGQAPNGVVKIAFEEVRQNLATLVQQAGS